MEQRDIIMDQIEQLGKVIAKIMSDFLGLKSKGNFALGIEISNERFQDQLDINIEELITLNKSELKEYFKNKKLTWTHLEVLSEYLTEIGIEKLKGDKTTAIKYLKKAIDLLDTADEISKTISFGRINKKSNIENLLQKCV